MSSRSSVCRGRRCADQFVLRPAASAPGRDAERRGDRGGHQRRIGQRRQIDPDHAVGEVRGHVAGDGQGQPGLADPAGSGQGQQRDRLVEQERPRRRDLGLAADEPGAGDGERSE